MPSISAEQKYLPVWSYQSYLLNMLALIFIANHSPSIKSNLTKLILLSIYMCRILFLDFTTRLQFSYPFLGSILRMTPLFLNVFSFQRMPSCHWEKLLCAIQQHISEPGNLVKWCSKEMCQLSLFTTYIFPDKFDNRNRNSYCLSWQFLKKLPDV